MISEIWDQLKWVSPVEWIGMVTGITGVYLSIKEKLWAWPFFILCYLSYVYLSWDANLYAALLLNIVFIFISIYGWSNWIKSSQREDSVIHIQHTPKAHFLRVLGLVATFTFIIGWVLTQYTNAYLPYLDAFATSCAFTAQWMLSRKYIENWLCWILADCVYVYLWSAQGFYVSAALFIMFILLAIKGWFEWKRTIKIRFA
jgi:nicotinamide mononucleotide transporter